jgi:hypothetical protein
MKWYEKFANWISTRGGKRVMYRPNETGQPAKYLERFYIVKTPFIEIMLHRFFMSDAGELHDHPWHSFGWILAKGYNETVLDKNNQEITYFRSVGYFGARSAKSFHRVQLLADGVGTTWTVFVTLKRHKNWGFLTTKGWIPFNHYFKSNGTLEVQELPQHYEGWVFPRKVMTP